MRRSLESRLDLMPPEKGRLREGFTTGTAATAAACAAFRLLLGLPHAAVVHVPLPPFSGNTPTAFLDVPVQEARLLAPRAAQAMVIKDGGDDPDATHKAHITALVELAEPTIAEPTIAEPTTAEPTIAEPTIAEPTIAEPAVRANQAQQQAQADKANPGPSSPSTALRLPGAVPLLLMAGEGIGRVTLPGLPVAVGEPAINPVPRSQIQAALTVLAEQHGYTGGLRVTLSIPGGETLAKKTLNPRLGIVGGLSILGTHGTVRPFSHEAWQATITEGISVARATGCHRIALSTGRRSERLLQSLYPDTPPQAFIQAADFAQFSLQAAVDAGFTHLAWGCFFGKLIKLAQGLPYTHARTAPLDLAALAVWCHDAGMPLQDAEPLADCLTAGQALEHILSRPSATDILQAVTVKAKVQAERFAPGAGVTIHLFHMNGKELARA